MLPRLGRSLLTVGRRTVAVKSGHSFAPSTSSEVAVKKPVKRSKVGRRAEETAALVENVHQLDAVTQKLVEELPQLDDEDEFRRLFGSGLIKDRERAQRVEEMEDENSRVGRAPNRFRAIVYDEGELDRSDFSKPPSANNPHPFDPSTLPPTHARSLAAYVNHLPALQLLVDIGMNLYEADLEPRIGQELLKLDVERDIKPKLAFLLKEVGVDQMEIGSYLTRNPFFLIQKNKDLKQRLEYLQHHKFSKEQIAKIVVASRYWLNTDYAIIDARLGYLQRQFQLNGDDLRSLITKEPRLISFGTGPLQRIVLLLNSEFEYEAKDVKKILFNDPRVFMMAPEQIRLSFHYLTRVMKIEKEQIAEFPLGLRCSIAHLRRRHEFLNRLKLNQYNPELPDFIPLEKILHPSDKHFSEVVCRKFLADYEKFLKTL